MSEPGFFDFPPAQADRHSRWLWKLDRMIDGLGAAPVTPERREQMRQNLLRARAHIEKEKMKRVRGV